MFFVLKATHLFHLYHPEKSMSEEAADMFKQKISLGIIKCKNGINSLGVS